MSASTPADRTGAWLWIAQRASAAVLALAVAVHLATIIAAVQGGLSAAEILARVRGHGGWLAFYAVFVAAAAVHAPIGLRGVLRDWTALRPGAVDLLSALFAAALLVLGLRAVLALYAGPTG